MELRQKVYCQTCAGYRDYTEQAELETLETDGVKYQYLHMRAFCMVCNKQVNVTALNMVNQRNRNRAYYDAYFKKNP